MTNEKTTLTNEKTTITVDVVTRDMLKVIGRVEGRSMGKSLYFMCKEKMKNLDDNNTKALMQNSDDCNSKKLMTAKQ